MPTVSNIQPARLPAHNHLLFANREVVNKSQDAQVAGGSVVCGKRGKGGLLQLHTADYKVYNIQCIMYDVHYLQCDHCTDFRSSLALLTHTE